MEPVDAGERERLLNEAAGGSGSNGTEQVASTGVRERPVPRGRKVAENILNALAEAEHITGVPAVKPGDLAGSVDWNRAEAYWKDRYTRSRKQVIKNKVEAVCWLVAGFAVLNGTDFLRVVFTDERVNRFFLNIALLATVTILFVLLYLIFWLALVHDVDWERIYKAESDHALAKSPHKPVVRTAIGTASGALVCSLICYPVALWPVWGLWTFPILAVLSMSCLMMMHFIPSFG